MTRRDGPLILIFAVIFCAVLVHNVFNPTLTPSSRTLHARQDPGDKPDCTTALAKDLYGLGVRLGIYFQWLSGWVANNFVIEEIAGALDANAIFLFALSISIVNSSHSNDLTQIDGMIILQLCSGTIWSVLSLWGYRTCVFKKDGLDGIRRFGGFGTHLRLALIVGVGSYGIWYWRIGIKGLPEGLDDYGMVSPTCPRHGIVVLGIPIKGVAAMGGLTLSVAAIVYGGLMVLVSPLALITRVSKMVFFMRTKSYASISRLRYATGASEEQLVFAHRVFGVFNFIWILFIMTVIEITLNENYQIGVLGGTKQSMDGQILMPAQLLPMLIGAFSFARILWISFSLWRNPDGDISPSLGRHDSRRNAQAKAKHVNPFGLFSQRLEQEVPEEEQGLRIHTDGKAQEVEAADDDMEDQAPPLYLRLGFWERILITWLPWLSLLYYWPWQKEVLLATMKPGSEVHHLTPRTEPISLQTPHKTRFSSTLDEDIEIDDIDTSYRRSSRVSATEQHNPQNPHETM